jgi:hypothetical protein
MEALMKITSLYTDYFKKSRVFLYPALGIKRGVSVTPIETYVSLDGYCKKEDAKLCCLYHLRKDADFRQFEKTKLYGNPLFHDFKMIDDNKGIYIFNLAKHKHEWDCFLKGKYSKMTPEHKKRIKEYIGRNSPHLPYVESFLYPEKYYKLYSEMMGVKETLLRQVGELCSHPDLLMEELNISVINLQFHNQIP